MSTDNRRSELLKLLHSGSISEKEYETLVAMGEVEATGRIVSSHNPEEPDSFDDADRPRMWTTFRLSVIAVAVWLLFVGIWVFKPEDPKKSDAYLELQSEVESWKQRGELLEMEHGSKELLELKIEKLQDEIASFRSAIEEISRNP